MDMRPLLTTIGDQRYRMLVFCSAYAELVNWYSRFSIRNELKWDSLVRWV